MKIHILGPSLKTNSGFAIVTRYLGLGLKRLGHDVSISGLQTIYQPEYSYGMETLPTQVLYIDDVSQYILNLQRIKPDVGICIFQADSEFNQFATLPIKGMKTIWYTLVEGKDIPENMENSMKAVIANGGKIVVPTKYAQNELKLCGIDSDYIPYGYDNKIFSAINDFKKYCYFSTDVGIDTSDQRKVYERGCIECKYPSNNDDNDLNNCQFFQEEIVTILRMVSIVDTDGKGKEKDRWLEREIKVSDLQNEVKGRFVYLFIGYNLGVRKRIERLLTAYSMLINNSELGSRQLKDRTVLWLHSRPMARDGVDLLKVVHKLGLTKNVIFSHGKYGSSGWSDQSMNILYNMADVQVTASSTEGFCLPALHSMAVGAPVIAPDCSAFSELIGKDEKEEYKRGILANIVTWQMLQGGDYRALLDERDMANKMKILYQDEKLRKKLGDNALKWVKNYTWDKSIEKWDKLLKDYVQM